MTSGAIPMASARRAARGAAARSENIEAARQAVQNKKSRRASAAVMRSGLSRPMKGMHGKGHAKRRISRIAQRNSGMAISPDRARDRAPARRPCRARRTWRARPRRHARMPSDQAGRDQFERGREGRSTRVRRRRGGSRWTCRDRRMTSLPSQMTYCSGKGRSQPERLAHHWPMSSALAPGGSDMAMGSAGSSRRTMKTRADTQSRIGDCEQLAETAAMRAMRLICRRFRDQYGRGGRRRVHARRRSDFSPVQALQDTRRSDRPQGDAGLRP